MTAIALTIAGSDSGGGAGIQADLKAFSAHGVYGASVVTAVTAQNTQNVSAVHAIPIEIVKAQIHAVLSDLHVTSIKIGMLFSAELVNTVAECLKDFNGHIVLDPVMVAKSGDKLLQQDAIDALKQNLIPNVSLLTPNFPEAEVLLNLAEGELHKEIKDEKSISSALIDLGAHAVLLKGGHGLKAQCTDTVIIDGEPTLQLTSPRINTVNTHGTGCTYSASIAALLAKGCALKDAIKHAHRYLHQAIVHADTLSIGKGHGPVHHFHELWKYCGK